MGQEDASSWKHGVGLQVSPVVLGTRAQIKKKGGTGNHRERDRLEPRAFQPVVPCSLALWCGCGFHTFPSISAGHPLYAEDSWKAILLSTTRLFI